MEERSSNRLASVLAFSLLGATVIAAIVFIDLAAAIRVCVALKGGIYKCLGEQASIGQLIVPVATLFTAIASGLAAFASWRSVRTTEAIRRAEFLPLFELLEASDNPGPLGAHTIRFQIINRGATALNVSCRLEGSVDHSLGPVQTMLLSVPEHSRWKRNEHYSYMFQHADANGEWPPGPLRITCDDALGASCTFEVRYVVANYDNPPIPGRVKYQPFKLTSHEDAEKRPFWHSFLRMFS
mgnify:CR=1 FL=1